MYIHVKVCIVRFSAKVQEEYNIEFHQDQIVLKQHSYFQNHQEGSTHLAHTGNQLRAFQAKLLRR